ncbi:DNA-processing protein DprA [Trinickia caryophylli]|nr:DNA-processing protein DprA [Trinickia caryophylli]TRX18944.1 DNA-protecting protein DprA [Trinickia caryophylli]WQE10257.1 DNA-processing protein DprA [Trinickia caryophylli]GLU34297.1 DNA processing protein DprA [Trinickia caryophylli]
MRAHPINEAELGAWLALTGARGLGPVALRALLAAFGSPMALRAQPFGALAAVAGEAAARAVLAPPPATICAHLPAVTAWCAQPDNHLLALTDPAYPPGLLAMHDPPPLLYVKGRLDLLHTAAIAIVGSRDATPQGLEDAGRFAEALARAGLAVVSGLALGIDGAAHHGALRAERGGTVAVVGTGIDLVYPARHHALAHAIAAQGAIVSEWPLGTPARPAHFPQRNRLIAGLVKGVLVVEAAVRSGSLITARLANEMGRDVFALPGSIHAPLARGCHALIKEGARLTETPEEILDELGLSLPSAPRRPQRADAGTDGASGGTPDEPPDAPSLSPKAERVLAALGHAPATLEILAARTDLPGAALQAALLELELRACAHALPGGRFVRAARAGPPSRHA